MGSGHFFGMEPPVISCCLFKCQFIILEVVFAHKDIESVTGNIVERFGFCLCFGTLFAGIMLFDVTILGKLFLDLAQITFCTGNIECVGYGFQMLDLGFGIGKLFVQSFFRTFELAIAVKIFFGVFLWGESRIQRNGDFFVGVIIQCLERFASLSGTLRFVQESRSGNAAEKLLAMITTTCTVTRREQEKIEIPMDDLVVGDIVHLAAGDMIPADVRILEAKDLFISQSSLTGESEPIEKTPSRSVQKESITDYTNIAFMGSNVISGSAAAVVVSTGDATLFGSMASAIAGEAVETSFTKGVNAVSWVLIRFMLVMVPLVFFINGITKGDWLNAFLFGISIAVGLTPEMLPMIVTTCLAKGAVSMSKKQTIVKNLNSIQNFGAMDILCTDKTGTLTQDRVVLEYHLNVNGEDDTRVLRHAYLNSYFQTGYKNLMDVAIIHKTEEAEETDSRLLDLSENYVKVDEIPFDFTRRRLTTVVQDKNGKTQMVTKGAVEEMLSICAYAECDGSVHPLTKEVRRRILKTVDELNEKGFRVLAIAQKSNPSPVESFGVKDECDMVLIGYLAFLDPPKESTADAIRALQAHGVTTKILTGDNDKVTRTICKQVGLEVRNMLLGSDLDGMTDEALARAAETTDVFAKLTPDQKSRVVSVLRETGIRLALWGMASMMPPL